MKYKLWDNISHSNKINRDNLVQHSKDSSHPIPAMLIPLGGSEMISNPKMTKIPSEPSRWHSSQKIRRVTLPPLTNTMDSHSQSRGTLGKLSNSSTRMLIHPNHRNQRLKQLRKHLLITSRIQALRSRVIIKCVFDMGSH